MTREGIQRQTYDHASKWRLRQADSVEGSGGWMEGGVGRFTANASIATNRSDPFTYDRYSFTPQPPAHELGVDGV